MCNRNDKIPFGSEFQALVPRLIYGKHFFGICITFYKMFCFLEKDENFIDKISYGNITSKRNKFVVQNRAQLG
jgi:hypothetical protein